MAKKAAYKTTIVVITGFATFPSLTREICEDLPVTVVNDLLN